MSERKDITQFATSMLAGSRQRRDDTYQRSVDDRDRQASEARKRERKQLLYGYGAKAVLSIGNSMVRSATENFLNQEPVLQKNIKFKSALNGATGRMNDRQEALNFEGGEEEFWRQKAAAELTSSFNKAVPKSYNATQREQLLYNETMKAGKELKKLYNSSADQDKLLLERVGTDGADAYTKALTTSRGTDVGSALMRKFKGLFRQDGDPLDNSVKANELFKSSENVVAYGELRRAGLSPFKSEEKIKEWSTTAKGMSVAITGSENITIKIPVTDAFGGVTTYDKSVTAYTLGNGKVKLMDLASQSEVTKADVTYNQVAASFVKKFPKQIEQARVSLSQTLSQDEKSIMGKYNKLHVQDATDPDAVKAIAHNQYAKIAITQQTLTKKQEVRPQQAEALAAKMHVLNVGGMIEEKTFGSSLREENNIISGSTGFHPLLAYLAATDIEDSNSSSVSFNDSVKRGFLQDYAVNGAQWDEPLSTQARGQLLTLLENRPEAALALEAVMNVDTEESEEIEVINNDLKSKSKAKVVSSDPSVAAYNEKLKVTGANRVYDLATNRSEGLIKDYNRIVGTIERQGAKASTRMKETRERSLLKIQAEIAKEMKRTQGYIPDGAADSYTRYLELINATGGV